MFWVDFALALLSLFFVPAIFRNFQIVYRVTTEELYHKTVDECLDEIHCERIKKVVKEVQN